MTETTDPRCAKCGKPRSNHPYRHPFVGPIHDDTLAARVKELEAKNDRLAQALDNAVYAWNIHQDSGDHMDGWWVNEARTALQEYKTDDQ